MSLLDAAAFEKARQDAGFKRLADLAKAAGVAIGTLSELESGTLTNPRIETLQRIARAVGKPTGYFFTAEVQESEHSTPAA